MNDPASTATAIRAKAPLPDSKLDTQACEKEETSCNLIVNYLPLSYRERHLSKLFSKIGDIKSCRVMRFVQDGRTLSKGYGFVKYHTMERALAAIEQLNGINVLGKTIKVSFARPSAQRTRSNLFVSQIPKRWSSNELKQHFSTFGNIIESRVLRTDAGESRRCGFVRFDCDEQAEIALTKLNGHRPSNFDVPIRVRIATQHEKNKSTKAKLSTTRANPLHQQEAEIMAIPHASSVIGSSAPSSVVQEPISQAPLANPERRPANAPQASPQGAAAPLVLTPAPELQNETLPFSRNLISGLTPAPTLRESPQTSPKQPPKPRYYDNEDRYVERCYPPQKYQSYNSEYAYYEQQRMGKYNQRTVTPNYPHLSSPYAPPRRPNPSYRGAPPAPASHCRDPYYSSVRSRMPSKRDPTYRHPELYPDDYANDYGLDNASYRHSYSKKPSPSGRKTDVHFVNIPLNLREEELYEIFSSMGTISVLHVPTDASGRRLGMVFVSYTHEAYAKQAVHEMNGSILGRNKIHASFVDK